VRVFSFRRVDFFIFRNLSQGRYQHHNSDGDQPLLRCRYQEMSTRHASRRSDFAGHELSKRLAATNHGRPDRSVGERLVNEQLEDRQRWVRESGWECRRDRHRRGRTGEDAADRAASFVQTSSERASLLSSCAVRRRCLRIGLPRESLWKLAMGLEVIATHFPFAHIHPAVVINCVAHSIEKDALMRNDLIQFQPTDLVYEVGRLHWRG